MKKLIPKTPKRNLCKPVISPVAWLQQQPFFAVMMVAVITMTLCAQSAWAHGDFYLAVLWCTLPVVTVACLIFSGLQRVCAKLFCIWCPAPWVMRHLRKHRRCDPELRFVAFALARARDAIP